MDGVDIGRTAYDYGKYRRGFPDRFFKELYDRKIVTPHEHALDLGTGTGTVARGLARLNMHVRGLDPAPELLEEAKRLDREAGVTVEYIEGCAEQTGESDGVFDLVTAGQCWHWFDRTSAVTEARRILRVGGTLVIAHLDWIPLRGNLVQMTEALICEFNPTWSMGGGTGLYPQWTLDLSESGFVSLESFSFDIDLVYTHEQWAGRIRASAGVGGSLEPDEVDRFDNKLRDQMAEAFPDNELPILHRVWCLYGTRANDERLGD